MLIICRESSEQHLFVEHGGKLKAGGKADGKQEEDEEDGRQREED